VRLLHEGRTHEALRELHSAQRHAETAPRHVTIWVAPTT
jgi:hypothetical protein